MSRYKLILQYNGAEFFGWQKQLDKRTVQGELEKAVAKLNKGHRVVVNGAGRTDTGVHALGQVCHFDLDTKLDTIALKSAINGNLADDVRIRSVEQVDLEFHSRFDATSRKYIYQCYQGSNLLYNNQTWLISDVNIPKMNSVTELIIGTHNFLSFAKYNGDLNDTNCTILAARWSKTNEMLNFSITGNRFLHHMVRYLVGTMIAIGTNKFSEDTFVNLLQNPKKNVRIFKAPPQGLILEKVAYE
jgi:tRNA pseudouridine38-40 synthase